LASSAAPLLFSPVIGTTWGLTLLWAAAGVASALQVLANAAFVLAVPPELRGRAFGLAMAVLMGSQGLALLLGGVLADVIDPRWVVALFAAAGLASVPALARWSPERVRPAQARHTSRRDHA
jgi:MFS family permease